MEATVLIWREGRRAYPGGKCKWVVRGWVRNHDIESGWAKNRPHILVLNLSSKVRFRKLVLMVFKPFPPHIRSIGDKDDGILGSGATDHPHIYGNRIASVAEWGRHFRVGAHWVQWQGMVRCDTIENIRLTDLAGSLEVVRRQF